MKIAEIILGFLLSLLIGLPFLFIYYQYYDYLLEQTSGTSINRIFNDIFKRLSPKREENFTEKIARLTNSLESSSREIDQILLENADVIRRRTNAIIALETNLQDLAQREQEVRARVEALEQTPIEAIKYFQEILNKGDKRSAWRDYVLFALGVVVSTIVTIILKQFGY